MFPVLQPDPTARRQLGDGPVAGAQSGHHTQCWLGIPYAAPADGRNRWRAPQPVQRWTELRPVAFGPRCRQALPSFMTGTEGYVGEEACLTLNLWAPRARDGAAESGERLPVMVWIHGGGNVLGGADSFDGSKLAGRHRVIVVTVNYRLGPFGWLSHPALRASADSPEAASGNFGTLDLLAALRWVRANIETFGGDPQRVTIFGSSAGGWNVRSLVGSPLARGLFQRAIIQSNALGTYSRAEAENYLDDEDPGHPQSASELLLQLALDDALASDRHGAKAWVAGHAPEEIASYLRSKRLEQFEAAYLRIAQRGSGAGRDGALNRIKVGSLGSTFSAPKLFRDGVVLNAHADDAIWTSGAYNQVPMILGTARDEDKCFLAVDERHVERRPDGTRIRDTRRYDLVARTLSGFYKAVGADEPAQAMSQHQPGAIFVYRLDWSDLPTVNGVDLRQLNGALHGVDCPMLFGLPPFVTEANAASVALNDHNRAGYAAVSDAMLSYWAEFAHGGRPGRGVAGDLPAWEPWRDSDRAETRMLILDAPADGGIRMAQARTTRADVVRAISDALAAEPPDRRQELLNDVDGYFMTRLTPGELAYLRARLCPSAA